MLEKWQELLLAMIAGTVPVLIGMGAAMVLWRFV
jgi:hypothetical protein